MMRRNVSMPTVIKRVRREVAATVLAVAVEATEPRPRKPPDIERLALIERLRRLPREVEIQFREARYGNT